MFAQRLFFRRCVLLVDKLNRLSLHQKPPLTRTLSSSLQNKHIFRSPLEDVTIPNVSLTEYLKQKTEDFNDRVALISAETGEEISYGEMWHQIRAVASSFNKLGMQKNSVLALICPNCPEFAVSFMATVAAGGTVTTVNCLYTTDEIAGQLDDSNASFVVCHPAVLAVVREAVSKSSANVKHIISTHKLEDVSELDLPTLLEDDGSAYPSDLQIDPVNDVMVLPYSSGTTGKPKGVMLTHYNIVANLQQLSSEGLILLDSKNTELVFGVLPMFHIYGMVPCLMLSLLNGATMVTFNRFDPKLYISSMDKYKPSVLFTVPPIVNFLVQTPQVTPEMMQSVKYITCGAAPLGETLVSQIREKFPHDLLFQEGFGMTELSPVTHLTPGSKYLPGSCGQPIPNTLAKIVDLETGEPKRDGEGELCIKGPQVMKGYFNNEQATADTIDEDGWLHTGDIARVDDEEHFYIVDRVKELIKVKGFQVAPAEIEDLLRTLPGVADVAVIGIPDEKAGEVPRAYVVKNQDSVTEGQIEDFVSSKVSSHKNLAGGVVFVDAIPKSMTGKILRKDLRALAK